MPTLKIVIPMVLLLAASCSAEESDADDDRSIESIGASGLPAEKARALAIEHEWQERLHADADDPAKSAEIIAAKRAEAARVAAQLAAEVPPKWPEGIFADSEAPAPGTVFLGTNRWVGTVAGRSVAVYAGRAGDNPATGRLMVVNAGPDMSVDSSRFVDLPGSGALRITAAIGATLTIVDAQGRSYTFDAAAHSQ